MFKNLSDIYAEIYCYLVRASLICIFWNLIYGLPLTAQEYSYVNYNIREGLAGSVVYNIVQDHDGFIWFGTETGLSRFDGSRFKNFTTSDGLPDNEVLRLFVDSRNRVWILPFKNTLSYYWRGKIYNTQNDTLLKQAHLANEILFVVENKEGDLLFGETQRVCIIRKNGQVLNFDNIDGHPIVGCFWAGLLQNGKFAVSLSVTKLGSFILQEDGDSLKKVKVVAPTGHHFQIISYSDSLEISQKTDTFKLVYPHTNEVVNLLTPDRYVSWNRLNDSLISFNSFRVEIYNVRRKRKEGTLLEGKHISYVTIDRENNFWFATQGDGVYKLSSLEFKNYFFKQDQHSLPIYSVVKSGDSLFAGLSGLKLGIVNSKTGAVGYRLLGKTTSSPGRIMILKKLRDGSLLAGTDESLVRMKGSHFIKAQDVYTSVKSVNVPGDTAVVGLSIGALSLDATSLATRDTLWLGRTTAIYLKNDQYYVGTLDGLYIFNNKQKNLRPERVPVVLKARISAICEDRAGNVWVATNGRGVVGYRNGRPFAWINKDSGLTSNICRSIFANDNDLWIGTEQGLNKAVPRNNGFDITRYSIFDGLVSNIINCIYVEGPMVYLATPEGISFFDERKVNMNSMCALKITAVQSPARRWEFDTSGVVFPYKNRDIRIEYAGISFKSAGAITYRYRLKGFRDEWQQTSDNFLNYAALPSGDYELELQATNKFGVVSEIKKLAFTIEKPLWEKTWFRLMMVLLAGAAIWKFVHYRIQSERNKQSQKAATNRKMAELEQMALKAQMNPHFIFNSLHSIQQYVLDKDIRGANKYISDFARLIRLTLNISMQTKISLHDEINYISTYLELEKTRLETKFDYSVDVEEGIDVEKNYIPAMILQPHVENSIRHGVNNRQDKEGFIKVTFKTEKDYLVCIVQDNGVGRSATHAMKGEFPVVYQSKGMRLTQNRIELLNKDYELPIISEIEDVQAMGNIAGTKVTIRFPLTEVKKPD